MRDGDDAAVLSVSDLDDDQRAELRAAVGALVGLGVAGAEGAEAGAELGASVDSDASTAADVVAASLLADLPDGSSAPATPSIPGRRVVSSSDRVTAPERRDRPS